MQPIYGSSVSSVSLDGGLALSPAPATETFGVKVIQEAIAALPALMNRLEKKPAPTSPLQLVRAIKEAREAKMTDIADALERQLRAASNLEDVVEIEAEEPDATPPVFLPDGQAKEADVAAAKQAIVDLDVADPNLQWQKPLNLSDADKRELMTVEVAGGGSVYVAGPPTAWAPDAGACRVDVGDPGKCLVIIDSGKAIERPGPVNSQGMAYADSSSYELEEWPTAKPKPAAIPTTIVDFDDIGAD
jgi:hypothetical protein